MIARRAVKIIKRDQNEHLILVSAAELTETDAELKEQRVNTVNKWISERRENFGVEKASSEIAMELWRKNSSTA